MVLNWLARRWLSPRCCGTELAKLWPVPFLVLLLSQTMVVSSYLGVTVVSSCFAGSSWGHVFPWRFHLWLCEWTRGGNDHMAALSPLVVSVFLMTAVFPLFWRLHCHGQCWLSLIWSFMAAISKVFLLPDLPGICRHYNKKELIRNHKEMLPLRLHTATVLVWCYMRFCGDRPSKRAAG